MAIRTLQSFQTKLSSSPFSSPHHLIHHQQHSFMAGPTRMLRESGIQNFSVAVTFERRSKFKIAKTVFPKFSQTTIKFQCPPGCEVSNLIHNIASHLGGDVGFDSTLRPRESELGWKDTVSYPNKRDGIIWRLIQEKEIYRYHGGLRIRMSGPKYGSGEMVVEFTKQGLITVKEFEALNFVLSLAADNNKRTIARLEANDLKIYGFGKLNFGHSRSDTLWDYIVGYNQQKRVIEDTILLHLRNPEVYDDFARGISKVEMNQPKAVLFEGSSGTGKTLIAHEIAWHAGVPVVYVPLDIIMSEASDKREQLLKEFISFAKELPNGSIIFLDQFEAIAGTHGADTHKVAHGLLSFLRKQVNDSDSGRKDMIVAATNRVQDLDPALLSLFGVILHFELPDFKTRRELARQYADVKHLTESELSEFAVATELMSGSDIKDVCHKAEFYWFPKKSRKRPPVQWYTKHAADYRRRNNQRFELLEK